MVDIRGNRVLGDGWGHRTVAAAVAGPAGA